MPPASRKPAATSLTIVLYGFSAGLKKGRCTNMALIAVAITKQTLYHDQLEEFDNVYFYDSPIPQAGDENFRRLCEAIVALEQPVHSPEVEFTTGRVWSSGGTILENITLGLFDLDGVGTMSQAGVAVHSEASVLVSWECDRTSVLGRKVYMRKQIRPQRLPSGSTEGMARGKNAMSAAVMAPFKTYADGVDEITILGGPTFNLVTAGGRVQRATDNGVVNANLRTREFRRN
jgi:hypothetical protein